MPIEVCMPRLTHDMKSGKIVQWLKREGDIIRHGEALLEVETDKAVSEIESEADGTLEVIICAEGEDAPVGSVIARIIEKGEVTATENPLSAKNRHEEELVPQTDKRKFSSPIARKIAAENQLDINQIHGAGPGGRVIEADVRRFIEHTKGTAQSTRLPVSQTLEYETVPLTRVQQISAERMALAAQTIPQFVLEVDVDISEGVRIRERLKASAESHFSITALLIKACSSALIKHPLLNAAIIEGTVRSYKHINIGVAIATPAGLVVPVIYQANTLQMAQIQEILTKLKEQAACGKIPAQALENGTFTISNLGMYGIDRFTAIINPPQAAILAAGRIREIVVPNGKKTANRPFLTLRLSVDHRVLDGAQAAPFLIELKNSLENPYLLL